MKRTGMEELWANRRKKIVVLRITDYGRRGK